LETPARQNSGMGRKADLVKDKFVNVGCRCLVFFECGVRVSDTYLLFLAFLLGNIAYIRVLSFGCLFNYMVGGVWHMVLVWLKKWGGNRRLALAFKIFL